MSLFSSCNFGSTYGHIRQVTATTAQSQGIIEVQSWRSQPKVSQQTWTVSRSVHFDQHSGIATSWREHRTEDHDKGAKRTWSEKHVKTPEKCTRDGCVWKCSAFICEMAYWGGLSQCGSQCFSGSWSPRSSNLSRRIRLIRCGWFNVVVCWICCCYPVWPAGLVDQQDLVENAKCNFVTAQNLRAPMAKADLNASQASSVVPKASLTKSQTM